MIRSFFWVRLILFPYALASCDGSRWMAMAPWRPHSRRISQHQSRRVYWYKGQWPPVAVGPRSHIALPLSRFPYSVAAGSHAVRPLLSMHEFRSAQEIAPMDDLWHLIADQL